MERDLLLRPLVEPHASNIMSETGVSDWSALVHYCRVDQEIFILS